MGGERRHRGRACCAGRASSALRRPASRSPARSCSSPKRMPLRSIRCNKEKSPEMDLTPKDSDPDLDPTPPTSSPSSPSLSLAYDARLTSSESEYDSVSYAYAVVLPWTGEACAPEDGSRVFRRAVLLESGRRVPSAKVEAVRVPPRVGGLVSALTGASTCCARLCPRAPVGWLSTPSTPIDPPAGVAAVGHETARRVSPPASPRASPALPAL